MSCFNRDKANVINILCLIFGMGLLVAWGASANAGSLAFKSSLVWCSDGTGDYALPQLKQGSYEIPDAIPTDGVITSVGASWSFRGQVRLQVSTDDGLHYVPVVNGVPVSSGLAIGDRLRWRAEIGPESELTEIRIHYTDQSGVVASFGEPRLSGFKYRKRIEILGSSSGELFNYPVKIRVGESSLAEGYDVECNQNTREDFKDVQFTAGDGMTLLVYYRERVKGTSPSQVATFWVKIPQIPEKGVTIYLYYGNSVAEDLSNGHAVFDFFDHFEGTELNTEKWKVLLEANGRYSIDAQRLKLISAEIRSRAFQFGEGILEYSATVEKGNETRLVIKHQDVSLGQASRSQIAYASTYKGAEHCLAIGEIVKANDPKPIQKGIPYVYRVILRGSSILYQRYDLDFNERQADVIYKDANPLPQGPIGIKSIQTSGAENVVTVDWIRVRQAVDPEPTIQSVRKANEESVELAHFKNVLLAPNGNLVLAGPHLEASYTTARVSTKYSTRIVSTLWTENQTKATEPTKGKTKISFDFSLDGGTSFKMDCTSGQFYYASHGDFVPGKELVSRIKFARENKKTSSLEIEMLTITHSPGAIVLVSPNGGEKWSASIGGAILWSAMEYERDYPMSLEYSTDGGKSYTPIAKVMNLDGKYQWKIPADLHSTKALVKIADAYDPTVYDLSDRSFSIASDKDKEGKQESKQEPSPVTQPEPAVLKEKEPTMDINELIEASERPGTQLYELLIKMTDNYSFNPIEDARASYKEGDIVMVAPAGHGWTETERWSNLILKVYLTEEEARQLTEPKVVETGKKDREGHPITEVVKVRRYRFDLEKIEGLGKKEMAQMRGVLEDKTLSKEVIEEKK